jgi:hypothetical protein
MGEKSLCALEGGCNSVMSYDGWTITHTHSHSHSDAATVPSHMR